MHGRRLPLCGLQRTMSYKCMTCEVDLLESALAVTPDGLTAAWLTSMPACMSFPATSELLSLPCAGFAALPQPA